MTPRAAGARAEHESTLASRLIAQGQPGATQQRKGPSAAGAAYQW